MEDRYVVVKGLVRIKNGEISNRWFVLDKGRPFFILNEWIEIKTLRSENTGKKYALSICRYLNYLNFINKEYYYATKKDILNFLRHLLFKVTDDLKLASIEASLTYSTVRSYIAVIKSFYKHITDNIDVPLIGTQMKSDKHLSKSFFYGIMTHDYEEFITENMINFKKSKEYIKWYTPNQIESLLLSFLTLRDKAIFLVTIDGGMRIDEALSIKLADYNRNECLVRPCRSKGKTAGKGRPIILKEMTCQVIDRYILTERNTVESQSGKYTDSLFINLRKGRSQGDEVKPRAWLRLLKNRAKQANIDSEKIRTHSGRSSKTMELLYFQTEHPEEHLTDEIIRQWMGWKSSTSLDSYRNINDIRIAKKRAEKINKNNCTE